MLVVRTQLSFADYLTAIRRRSGQRQKTVAHRSGMDPSYLASLETGRRNPPSSEVMNRLLDAIGASAEERRQLHRLAFAHGLQSYVHHRAPPDWPEEGSEILAAVPMLSATQLRCLSSILKAVADSDTQVTTEEPM
ncbi:helix-turn-helix transcriptional regulator [Burkholderia cenocepacia]|uniref:helix-turn-helix domain-containing protein n=1 Tax=Burkholderia cenocepacia TaxID=95486 RepID=UPI0028BA647C|nr:helix-turn-helix transcriptional regulator [Burkholderia cenocepacia]MDT6997666.1 helix-turn-helix domain-containing protein [Burkholderia cenocepacia]